MLILKKNPFAVLLQSPFCRFPIHPILRQCGRGTGRVNRPKQWDLHLHKKGTLMYAWNNNRDDGESMISRRALSAHTRAEKQTLNLKLLGEIPRRAKFNAQFVPFKSRFFVWPLCGRPRRKMDRKKSRLTKGQLSASLKYAIDLLLDNADHFCRETTQFWCINLHQKRIFSEVTPVVMPLLWSY